MLQTLDNGLGQKQGFYLHCTVSTADTRGAEP